MSGFGESSIISGAVRNTGYNPAEQMENPMAYLNQHPDNLQRQQQSAVEGFTDTPGLRNREGYLKRLQKRYTDAQLRDNPYLRKLLRPKHSFSADAGLSRQRVDPFMPGNLSRLGYESSLDDPRFQTGSKERYLWGESSASPNPWSHAETRRNLNATKGVQFHESRTVGDPLAGSVDAGHVTFSRIAPDLVRDPAYQSPDRADENPSRGRWSQHWSQYEAESGTVNPSTIYTPEITSYHPRPYGSYGDVVGGQVQYYTSDTTPYRGPNFVFPSSVYKTDFRTPQGAIQPEYLREFHEDIYMGDSGPRDNTTWGGLQDMDQELMHREDMQSRIMRKMSSQEWKFRATQ